MNELRLPPHSVEAERSVIGAMLLSPMACDAAISMLRVTDFYVPSMQLMFSTITEMHSEGVAIDPVTVAERLAARGMLADVGGPTEIAVLFQEVPHAEHVRYYARSVRDGSRRRNLISECRQVEQQAFDMSVKIDKVAGNIAQRVDEIFHGSGSSMRTSAAAVDRYRESVKRGVIAIPTGLAPLDKMLKNGGLNPGLVILAGRPSMGKTAGLMTFAQGAADAGHAASIYSLEMTSDELVERLHSRGDEELERFSGQLIWIDDETCELSQILSGVRQSVRKNNTKIVFIDYLDYIEVSDSRLRDFDKIRVITKALKRLARSLKIPVVLLCQLNRKIEDRDDKRPKMSDLRMSGGLEQDADVVLALHRPSYYDPSDQPGDAEIHVLKQRGGMRGKFVTVEYKDVQTRFVEKVAGAEEYTFRPNF